MIGITIDRFGRGPNCKDFLIANGREGEGCVQKNGFPTVCHAEKLKNQLILYVESRFTIKSTLEREIIKIVMELNKK